jgi:hypothetical protein
MKRAYLGVILIGVLVASVISNTGRGQEQSGTGPIADAQPAQLPKNSKVGTGMDYPAEAANVHVILMVYDLDGNGPACQKDVAGFANMLKVGFGAKSDRLVFHDFTVANGITNRHWTPQEILAKLRQLDVGANDVVIIYQSGHGHIANRRDPEMTHDLQINGGILRRGDVMKIFRSKNIRALITLTDCCAACPLFQECGADADEAPALNCESVCHLFLRVRGEVSITASEPGTNAIASYTGSNPGQAGSAFTVAILRVLHEEQTYTNWMDFFRASREATRRASNGMHVPAAFQLPATK